MIGLIQYEITQNTDTKIQILMTFLSRIGGSYPLLRSSLLSASSDDDLQFNVCCIGYGQEITKTDSFIQNNFIPHYFPAGSQYMYYRQLVCIYVGVQ